LLFFFRQTLYEVRKAALLIEVQLTVSEIDLVSEKGFKSKFVPCIIIIIIIIVVVKKKKKKKNNNNNNNNNNNHNSMEQSLS